ncbi:sigma-70 family RNA polymerase sigma factor [Paenibacillus sophorae]|uniref:Sigma-70 family RNA polymerase sigma factor n=1 Tax=Paenibacillus sophorae TaxID=1333845 RepID=A0ABX8HH73_9BACL|nr:sigma-70 family RNA polymerase sigma factor [Paenibacillus sophorae]QWU17509.1 sigma-70 family RNA polymerase sigma factor [Paenibacillus sophorae]
MFYYRNRYFCRVAEEANVKRNVEGEGRQLEEAEWISAVLNGERQAFAHLVTRYQGLVYRVCIKITGESESAKDMAQEVFIKAYKALPSFRGQSSFSTWLYRIAYRTCLDWKRANDREWKYRSMADYTENDYVTSQTPEHAALRKEASEELGQSVNSLAEPYRSVVQLYYFNRQSYQEIAEAKGISVKTVESQLYRARQIMRRKGERWE